MLCYMLIVVGFVCEFVVADIATQDLDWSNTFDGLWRWCHI